jgi:hypothetical protein
MNRRRPNLPAATQNQVVRQRRPAWGQKQNMSHAEAKWLSQFLEGTAARLYAISGGNEEK